MQWTFKHPVNSSSLYIPGHLLHHEVSPHVDAPYGLADFSTTRAELNAALLYFDSLRPALEDEKQFTDFILKLHQEVTGGSIQNILRVQDVRTKPDIDGKFIIYPSATYIEEDLSSLRQLLLMLSDERPFVAFLAAYLFLLNIHPFVDGNGRVARSLANTLLLRAFGRNVWIPIKELASISRRSLLLSTREAHLFSTWAPASKFMGTSVFLLSHIATNRLLFSSTI